ncbi:hypothetical protein LCGC14_0249150 [marine sediment metagenome]|uniref:Uncharacterized protein n=1 Tax=marine sediment metagenome TaxID=412755 RepID=A0A0F9ULM6_9ZZZZ
MRIECRTMEAFLENLKGESIFLNTVYVDKTKQSLTDKSVREASSVSITLQASTLLDFEDETLFLLVCGIDCGIDRHTEDGGLEGTKQLDVYLLMLEEYCKGCGIKLKPGILDM